MKQVKALKTGDTIGIAAPASPFDRTKFLKGTHALEHLGFKVFYRRDIFDQNRYLAGTDARRAEEFTELIQNRNVSAIMFARGGYGSQRIIPLLEAATLSEHPKPVIGFSDITALLTFLRQSCNIPTFYGPVLTQLGSAKEREPAEVLFRMLTTGGAFGEIPSRGTKVIKPGTAEGPVVGGCLSLINSSIGTPYELKTEGTILFIEEVNEKVYVLDRMLTQLKNGKTFDTVKAVIFGSIVEHKDEPYDPEPMIRDVLADFKGPIVTGFPAGHIDNFITLPMGATLRIDARLSENPAITYTSGLLI